MTTRPEQTGKKTLHEGVKSAWPICLGYIPIGLAFGVLARKAGLSPFQIGIMSIFVFAGSSQFIAVSMIVEGAGPLAIIATTFMVNLRHLLMSSSLSVFPGKAGKLRLSLFAYGITDESFAINFSKFAKGFWDLDRAIVLNQTANLVWILSTIAGGFGGQFIPEKAFGIDYALIAMFICLLVFQLRGHIYVISAVLSGMLAVFLSIRVPGNSYIVIASMVAAAVGVGVKRKFLIRGKKT
ncbi:MAG: AzlC family ABC transporter permease [Proteobacteria bacterium]|nr:AzlC family ABC transporter permease [Pseudomonadota bacterium]